MAGFDVAGLLSNALNGGDVGNPFGGLLKNPFDDVMNGSGLLGFDPKLNMPAISAAPAADPAAVAAPSAPAPSTGYDWSALGQALGSFASTAAEASQKNYGTMAGLGAGGGSFASGLAAAKKQETADALIKAQTGESTAKAAAAGQPGAQYGDSVDAGAIRTRAAQILSTIPNPTAKDVTGALTQAFNEVSGGKVDTYTDAGGVQHLIRRDPVPGALNAPAAGAAPTGLPAPQGVTQAPGGLSGLPDGTLLPPPSGSTSTMTPKAQVAGQEQLAKNIAAKASPEEANDNVPKYTDALALIDQARQLNGQRFDTALKGNVSAAIAKYAGDDTLTPAQQGKSQAQLNLTNTADALKAAILKPTVGGNQISNADVNFVASAGAFDPQGSQGQVASQLDRLQTIGQRRRDIQALEQQAAQQGRAFGPADVQAYYATKGIDYDTGQPLQAAPGAPASAPAPSGRPVAVAKTKADYDKLPAGTRYRGPDGNERIKQ